MRKLALLFLLLCGFAVPASATYAHVACSTSLACMNNTLTSPLAIPASSTLTFTAGNLLVLTIRAGSTDVFTIGTVTSSPSENWYCGAPANSKTPSGTQVELCWANNIAGGSTYTISIPVTGASVNIWASVDEFSGSPASCADPSNGARVTGVQSGGLSVTSASLTTTGTDLLFAGVAFGANEAFNAITAGAMFGTTATKGNSKSSSTTIRAQSEYRLNIASGSGTAAMSWTTTSTDAVMAFMGFLSVCPGTAHTMPPAIF